MESNDLMDINWIKKHLKEELISKISENTSVVKFGKNHFLKVLHHYTEAKDYREEQYGYVFIKDITQRISLEKKILNPIKFIKDDKSNKRIIITEKVYFDGKTKPVRNVIMYSPQRNKI